jgi:hypothetical protein
MITELKILSPHPLDTPNKLPSRLLYQASQYFPPNYYPTQKMRLLLNYVQKNKENPMPNSTQFPSVIASDLTATITSSTSLSAAIDLKGTALIGYILPSSWTAADITFRGSIDGTNFFDIYNQFGSEVRHVVAANRFIALTISDLASVRYLKIRSGTSATPVNQAADRILNIVSRSV